MIKDDATKTVALDKARNSQLSASRGSEDCEDSTVLAVDSPTTAATSTPALVVAVPTGPPTTAEYTVFPSRATVQTASLAQVHYDVRKEQVMKAHSVQLKLEACLAILIGLRLGCREHPTGTARCHGYNCRAG